jgi:hypothetical protein
MDTANADSFDVHQCRGLLELELHLLSGQPELLQLHQLSVSVRLSESSAIDMLSDADGV